MLKHGHMPSCLSDAIVQPVPKGGNKDYSLSTNYQGIALASCLRLLKCVAILELYRQHLLSSQLQFYAWSFHYHMHRHAQGIYRRVRIVHVWLFD